METQEKDKVRYCCCSNHPQTPPPPLPRPYEADPSAQGSEAETQWREKGSCSKGLTGCSSISKTVSLAS